MKNMKKSIFIYLLLLCSISIFAQDVIAPPRTCTVCKVTKPASEFSGDSKTCKACAQKAAEEKERKKKAEAERQRQLEQERIAREQAERERIAREKAEKDRLAREQAERERIAFRDKVNSLIKMVYVEGGTFTMGGYIYSILSSEPEHQVTVSSFSIGETEVTQELWEIVMGSNPSKLKGTKLPVNNVKWSECQEFISKVNQITGKNYRLPTEAEWEYAARGGSKSKGFKYIGSNDVNEVSWYKENSGGTMHDVRMKKPNELGLYDMGGNVEEWCQDWYGNYLSIAQTNPTGPSSGTKHVLRGGDFRDKYGGGCTPSYRWAREDDYAQITSGLRLILPSSESDRQKSENVNQSERDRIIQKAIKEMVYVEGGTFMMGKGAGSDKEKPAHQVTLSSFSIGKTEVTRELWEAVMESPAPSDLYTGTDALCPVSNVSWDECQKFIAKLNELTGKKFRLPTEAEWEFAARGGNKSKGFKYSGSNKISDVAHTHRPYTVATKMPNELGLYDMSGNVSEWCQDWFGNYSASAQTNPTGPSSGTKRVHRSGNSYHYDNWLLKRTTRVFDRDEDLPNEKHVFIGLRLAL